MEKDTLNTRSDFEAMLNDGTRCFVPANEFDKFDYKAKTAVIGEYVRENKQRTLDVLDAMAMRA